MRPSDVANALRSLIPTKRPCYLWGPPGVGKSSLVHQAAESLELDVLDLRAVLLDPVDMRGLPRISQDGFTAQWVPPAFLPRGGRGVLFLDELAQAPPLVQAACLQLTLDRRVGEYILPDEWSIIAASNRQEDRAGAHRLISPLLNRFIHLDLEVSTEDWQAWALAGNVLPEVRAFLNYRPGLLFDFDPSSQKRAFPTPRSWSFVSDVLPATPGDLLHPVISGCVGEGPAAEFVGFIRIWRELPDLDDVLKDPTKAHMPKDPAVLFAISGALVEKMRGADRTLLGKFIAYANRMPDEFSVLSMRDAGAMNPIIFQAPGASDWHKKHKDVMLSARSA